MSADPTLLFCLGAPKAGTSWLYRYLSGHPECHLRSIKELHFFDALDEGRATRQAQALERKSDKLERQQIKSRPDKAIDRARRIADMLQYAEVLKSGDEAGYLSFLNDGRAGECLIADITPSYSLLSEQRLQRMADMSSDVRFLYLLRDPVARMWSHVRMIARRRTGAKGDIAQAAGEILERVFSGAEKGLIQRCDYRASIVRMKAALDPSRLLLLFYEEMFSNAAISRLCAYLGISDHKADFDRRVHEGVSLRMTGAQRARAAQMLRPQYEFVEASFGRVPRAWEMNRVGV